MEHTELGGHERILPLTHRRRCRRRRANGDENRQIRHCVSPLPTDGSRYNIWVLYWYTELDLISLVETLNDGEGG